NLKDPEKIAAKLAEAEANHKSNFLDKAALCATTGRVLAIGLIGAGEKTHREDVRSFGDTVELRCVTCQKTIAEASEFAMKLGTGQEKFRAAWADHLEAREFSVIGHDDEAALLKEFWTLCGETPDTNRMVGFNSNNF